MATIQDLPEEILLMIFEHVSPFSVEYIQTVCKAWYVPAHIMFLKSIRLENPEQLEHFIASIDSNPSPRYLNAVKELTFSTPQWGSFDTLEDQDIQKMFFRFPNLIDVSSYGGYALFERFDDQVCQEFLNSCKKLDSFEFTPVESGFDSAYYELTYRLRLLLTRLDIHGLKSVAQYGGIVPYITSFPRLRFLESESPLLDSFRHKLLILEKLPDLVQFSVLTARDEKYMFAESLFEDKSQHTINTIIERLSNVKELSWGCANDLCLNSAKFIAKYLTNLSILNIQSHSCHDWTPQQACGFATTILDLVTSQKHCYLTLDNMVASSFSICLPAILQKMNGRVDSRKILHVKLQFYFRVTTPIDLHINCSSGQFSPTIYVSVREQLTIQQVAAEVFGQVTPLHDLDEFVLEIKQRDLSYYHQEANVYMYDSLLKIAPTVTKVTLDVPAKFVDLVDPEHTQDTYPLVETLILRGTSDAKFQTLLDRCSTVFPQLNRLEIYYFCGIWNKETGEFCLRLSNYSLEHLIVDVTAVVDNSPTKNKFFVVETNVDGRRRLFQVTNDFSLVSSINDDDLDGKKYFKVDIVLKKVDHLELYLNTASRFHYQETYMHQEWLTDSYSKYITLDTNIP